MGERDATPVPPAQAASRRDVTAQASWETSRMRSRGIMGAATMRFALFPYGSRGDVQPIVALGRTLKKRGHDVVLGTAATFAPMARDAGLEFAEVGGDFEAFMKTVGEELSSSPRELLQALGRYIDADVPRAFAETIEAARGADVVVGASLQQAAPSAAEHLGIAFREIVFCPQTLPSSTWPPLNVPFMRMPGFLNRLAWRSVSFTMNRFVRAPVNAQRARLGLARVDDAIAHLRTHRPIVCADPGLAALPPDVRSDDDDGPLQTGALVVDDSPPLADDVERFLAAGPPPVYAGFGSMTSRDPERVTAAFVDVTRSRGARLILAGGWGGVARPRDPDERVLFIDGAPHTRLFPRCAFVVHHGGAGTTAAARAGVPQLVVAHAADQFYWGARVQALGVGPPWLLRLRFAAAALTQRLAMDWAPWAERARALAGSLATIDGNVWTAQALEKEARR